MAWNDDGARRFMIMVDAKAYSGGDDRRQYDTQSRLAEALDEAATAAGLDRPQWRRQDAGDGELAILPEGVREHRVVDAFTRELDTALRGINRDLVAEARVRLRVAMHVGIVTPAETGYAGAAVVAVSRLLNSDPVRQALEDHPDAALALILSDTVYQDLVHAGHTSLRPEQFRQASVASSGYHGPVWTYVPNTPAPAAAAGAATPGTANPATSPAPDQPSQTVVQVFGQVQGHDQVFGIRNDWRSR